MVVVVVVVLVFVIAIHPCSLLHSELLGSGDNVDRRLLGAAAWSGGRADSWRTPVSNVYDVVIFTAIAAFDRDGSGEPHPNIGKNISYPRIYPILG